MTERLEVGKSYVATGPAPDSKLGPPQEVEIVEVDEAAGHYVTKGARQVANVIAFGCEHMWRPLEEAPAAPVVWHDSRMVAFDVETTGVDPEEARIVTAAIAVCGGGLETETLALLADPGIEIPEGAAEIHGITTEKAQAEGQRARDVVTAVLDALTAYLRPGRPLVIFNARYDLTVLDREARRHGLVPLTERGFPLLVIDPLVIDKHLHRYRKGSRKLDAQAAHYGARLDTAHDAAADAIAAARVAWCIGKKGEVIRRVRHAGEAIEKRRLAAEWETVRHDLAALHATQARWAALQAASLEDYFRQQGKPEKVDRAWPVLPYVAPEPERLDLEAAAA